MSNDPNFENPSLDGSWTGGMVYWKCPRCHSEDVYKAKRAVGSMGPIGELGDSGNFMAVQRQAMVDVWLCRPCGETATKFKRPLTASEKFERKKENEGSGGVVLMAIGAVLFWLVVGGTIIWAISSS